MKRLFSLFLIAVFVFTFVACAKKDNKGEDITQTPVAGKYTPGTYEGKAQGYGGDIVATVVLGANQIESITCTGEGETEGIGSVALAQLPSEMVTSQSVQVDAISGATKSSKGVVEAVTQALTNAGVDVQTLTPIVQQSKPTSTVKEEIKSADVVVIGAGGAGMTAALEATNKGLKVIVLEKQAMAGGNTIKAIGGLNAAETKLQKDQKVNDSVESFVEDTLKGGNYTNNEALVRTLAENSAAAVDWLESIGAPLTTLTSAGGATNMRMHAPGDGVPIGTYIVDALVKQLKEKQVEILYHTKATDLIMDKGEIKGVHATGENVKYTINCEAVILATGGFGANADMIAEYHKEYKDLITTNTPGTDGDGIRMAQAVGAKVIDMDQIQVVPTVEEETRTIITEEVRQKGAILVNQNGERFFNEMSTRDLVSKAIMEQEGGYAYLIFDQQVFDNLSTIKDYMKADIVEDEENLAELADDIHVDEATLIQTIADWNKTITDKTTDPFNRTTGKDQTISKAPYYAVKVAPAIYHTMGGVEINTKAEVLSTNQSVIPGLFAAGEVTGGVHGESRIGGNAIAEVIVFGRIAGQSAVEYVGTH